MSELDHVRHSLAHFAQMNEDDFSLSSSYWVVQDFKKGQMYNPEGSICQYLGFIMHGYFRSYLMSEDGSEKNIFLFLPNQVVTSYKSFVHKTPCEYNTQALTDSRTVCITLEHLKLLYQKSHGWERFGRLLAERAFDVANDRAESFLFKTAEERYRDLIRMQPDVIENIPLYHISSYLGIAGPSLSRIRRRIATKRF